MSLGPFSSVAEIKRAIVSRRQLLSARAGRGWYSRGRAKVPDDELVLDLEALLDRLARLLVVRPRSRRKLWPDADDWLRVNNGETNAMGLLMQGRLKVKGSLPLATKFQSMFRREGA